MFEVNGFWDGHMLNEHFSDLPGFTEQSIKTDQLLCAHY